MRPATGEVYKALNLPRPSRKLYRLLRGPYSIPELAATMDVDQDTIRQWEDGTSQPSTPLLRALVDHYWHYAQRYNRDPLRLLPQNRRPRAPGAPAKKPAGTPAAPHHTAAKSETAPGGVSRETPPPSSLEGEAKEKGS